MKENSYMFQIKQKINKTFLIYGLIAVALTFFAFHPDIVLASGGTGGEAGESFTNSLDGGKKVLKALVNFFQYVGFAFGIGGVLKLIFLLRQQTKQNGQKPEGTAYLSTFAIIAIGTSVGLVAKWSKEGIFGKKNEVITNESDIFNK